MKIGILYICTGKYSIFWKHFYESTEVLLLAGDHKDYFVFTDAANIAYEEKENVHKIFQEKLEWPYPTLLRFHMFLKVESQLMQMDYIFFFNANMKVVSTITADDILPDPVKEEGLSVVLHSGFYMAKSDQLPYERKQKGSLAYLENGQYYFQGSFNGGSRDAYLKLVRQLNANVQKDLENNIIASWHDESHLNKYMADKHPKILSPAYAYPEGQRLEFTPKILMLDKNRVGSYKYLRGQKENLWEKLKHRLKRLRK